MTHAVPTLRSSDLDGVLRQQRVAVLRYEDRIDDDVREACLLDHLGHGLHDRRRREHPRLRSEEHTSELQSLMRISYAVFCLKKKTNSYNLTKDHQADLLSHNHTKTTLIQMT